MINLKLKPDLIIFGHADIILYFQKKLLTLLGLKIKNIKFANGF